LNSHFGYELSRRDDLQSLGYLMIYCLKGRLPWQNTFAKNKEEKLSKILTKKLQTSIKKLTADLPIQYEQYFHYVKSLEFQTAPDYNYIKNLFRELQGEEWQEEQWEKRYRVEHDKERYLKAEGFDIARKNMPFKE
jgi:hypothetical protein